ncbi:mechanosensitive ion channel family protein [Fusobacterium gastrosuis]|uniref:mechanosensitive ion channel family protein n=1 Tax=Fusobacterium gastrosuis TaxID=1755100 RepID=UPI002A932315|nr:mechanosensitive ion channel [Fusobacterium gastrosuis]
MNKEIIGEVITDKTMLDKIITENISKLEEMLPNMALKLISILVLLLIWPKIIRAILYMIEKTGKIRKYDPLLISFIKSLMKTLLYITLFFLIIGTIGVQATSLVTVLGTAGVAVGLALQGSLTNLAGGVIILFFKNVSKGDFISINSGTIEGTVKNIHILYTTITTPEGLALIVPNSQLANSAILNVSRNPTRRLDLIYSTSYDNSVDKTLKILEQIANEDKRILKDEEHPITISLIKHSASSLDYRFRVWTKKEDYFDTMYDVNKKVKELFDANQIEIPYNKLDIYKRN